MIAVVTELEDSTSLIPKPAIGQRLSYYPLILTSS